MKHCGQAQSSGGRQPAAAKPPSKPSSKPPLYTGINTLISFLGAGSVGTSLASQKFPAEHRLRPLFAGPFQLFFAFSTFSVLLPFSHFFRFFVPSFLLFRLVFIRKASCQQLIGIFPKYTADTQPCDGPPSRLLYHFLCGYRCD